MMRIIYDHALERVKVAVDQHQRFQRCVADRPSAQVSGSMIAAKHLRHTNTGFAAGGQTFRPRLRCRWRSSISAITCFGLVRSGMSILFNTGTMARSVFDRQIERSRPFALRTPLEGIDNARPPLRTPRKLRDDFVTEVHVAGGVDEVDLVHLAVARLWVVDRSSRGWHLNRDAPFTFQIHAIQEAAPSDVRGRLDQFLLTAAETDPQGWICRGRYGPRSRSCGFVKARSWGAYSLSGKGSEGGAGGFDFAGRRVVQPVARCLVHGLGPDRSCGLAIDLLRGLRHFLHRIFTRGCR